MLELTDEQMAATFTGWIPHCQEHQDDFCSKPPDMTEPKNLWLALMGLIRRCELGLVELKAGFGQPAVTIFAGVEWAGDKPMVRGEHLDDLDVGPALIQACAALYRADHK